MLASELVRGLSSVVELERRLAAQVDARWVTEVAAWHAVGLAVVLGLGLGVWGSLRGLEWIVMQTAK